MLIVVLGEYRSIYKQPGITKASKIWLDDVSCTGRESNIDECDHSGWGQHNCVHHKDVGVRCYGMCLCFAPSKGKGPIQSFPLIIIHY